MSDNPDLNNTTPFVFTPPKPPDKNYQQMEIESNKQKLSYSAVVSINSTDTHINELNLSNAEEEMYHIEESTSDLSRKIKKIVLTEDDKHRIYHPWRFSLIIKLVGKRILHQILKRKVQDLWKVNESFPLIDLGLDYYIVKFNNEESMIKVLSNGPWFIFGHYLSIRRWEPNFVPEKAKDTFSAIWIRLPQLPTEFYDANILRKIGNSIGRLLKIDACTSSTIRGRYARLCIEVNMEEQLQPYIYIGSHKQTIEYEGEGILCKSCGRLGHTTSHCLVGTKGTANPEAQLKDKVGGQSESAKVEEWKTVTFPKRQKGKQMQGQRGSMPSQGINVKIFEAHSELQALRQGLHLALECGFTSLEIETDSLDLLAIFKTERNAFKDVLYDCRELMAALGRPKIRHVFRECNMVADRLANEGMKDMNTEIVHRLAIQPSFVDHEMSRDSYHKSKRVNYESCTNLIRFGNLDVMNVILDQPRRSDPP